MGSIIAPPGIDRGIAVMEPTREQQLEEENELLRQQLKALTGSEQELGALIAMGHGMTQRTATILFILAKRAPAVVSRASLHSIFYGHESDGGPDPKIFDVHISRIRGTLRRLGCPGKIDTVWHAGYRASPELVGWIRNIYSRQIEGRS
jgi:DNA-binding response OmpR family regulator